MQKCLSSFLLLLLRLPYHRCAYTIIMSRAPRRRQLGGGADRHPPNNCASSVDSRESGPDDYYSSSDDNLLSSWLQNNDDDDDDGDDDDDDNNKKHKKRRRRRQPTTVLRVYERILSTMLVLLFFLTIAVLALFVLPKPTVGLVTPHTSPFAAVPTTALQRTVCIETTEQAVLQAFQARGWTIVPLETNQAYKDCHIHGQAAVVWTKSKYVLFW